jgi:peptidoglycan/xylan/chitin deacetylase (PgdA/CDA1 family)
MYHAVGTQAYGDSLGLFSIAEDKFRRQMTLLSDWRHGQIADFSEDCLSRSGNSVAITFDDGYQDNLEVAAPILIDLVLPFTVFVTSEFVRNSMRGFLTPSSLRILAGLPGVKIGAHGASHIALTQCDDKTLNQELISSRLYLEDLLGFSVDAIAYPYGAVDRRVRNATVAAGYRVGACSMAGINQPNRDPMLLCRTEIVSMDSEKIFMQKLQGNWDWYRWRTQDPACL